MTDEGLGLYIKNFLKYLDLERGASVHTIRAYEQDLKEFNQYCAADPAQVDMIDIRGFVSDRIMAGKERSTVARKLATLSIFFQLPVQRRIYHDQSGQTRAYSKGCQTLA